MASEQEIYMVGGKKNDKHERMNWVKVSDTQRLCVCECVHVCASMCMCVLSLSVYEKVRDKG